MVIWRGYGLVVPVVAVAGMVGVQLVVESLMGDGYWKTHRWPLQAAALLSGAALWWLGRRLNGTPARHWIDAASGIEFSHRPSQHSFFYVPVEWAGLVVALLMLALSLMVK